MRKQKKHITTGKAVGKKQEGRGKQSKSYIIYDSCYKCPLRVYIDIVCNDNYHALVVEGNPDEQTLREAGEALMAEFSEISGNVTMTRNHILLKEMYIYRSQLTAYTVCLSLLGLNATDDAVSFLNTMGLRCTLPTNLDETIQLRNVILSKIKEKTIRYKRSESEYHKLQLQSKSIQITPAYFTEQLVALSKWAGFRLTSDITLAEYAMYIKSMKEHTEQLNTRKNGEKHSKY